MASPHIFNSPDMFVPLNQAKDWLARKLRTTDGAICPCCGSHNKLYARYINETAIRDLVSLYKTTAVNGDGFYHYRQFMVDQTRHGDFSKFIHYGMLTRQFNKNRNKASSGLYSITVNGLRFVRGLYRIPVRMYLLHNELMATSIERKFIGDFWPDFNYAELMATGIN